MYSLDEGADSAELPRGEFQSSGGDVDMLDMPEITHGSVSEHSKVKECISESSVPTFSSLSVHEDVVHKKATHSARSKGGADMILELPMDFRHRWLEAVLPQPCLAMPPWSLLHRPERFQLLERGMLSSKSAAHVCGRRQHATNGPKSTFRLDRGDQRISCCAPS